MQVEEARSFKQASAFYSLAYAEKKPKRNIAKDETDESEINQIGFVKIAFVVIFGELRGYFGSWPLAAMCSPMEPCLWSGAQ